MQSDGCHARLFKRRLVYNAARGEAIHHFQKWRDDLHVAPNDKAVAGIMEDYTSAIDPFITILPPPCRKALLARPLNIQTAAVTLLLAELGVRGPGEVADVLHEISHTFASAAVRIAFLRGRAATPADRAKSPTGA